ncbi:MAG: efflux RND transporter periplasmic adaptor subunit [Anaplasmataceae bacterium]|nr:efflux RND transporter periplasmic adaptor subunit [Anaplasmataceae bacterium]
MKHLSTVFRHTWHWIKARPWKITIFILLLLGGGYLLFGQNNTPETERVLVKRGTIRETVNITGIVKPVQDAQLAFEKTGKVVAVNSAVGKKVQAGTVVVSLDTSELQAQLLETEGNVETQLARLSELKRGARPEDIEAKEAELAKASQDLTNLYQGIKDIVANALLQTEDAVRKQLNPLFNNDDELNVQLSFSISNSQLKIDVEKKRKNVTDVLRNWNETLSDISLVSNTSTLEEALLLTQESLREVSDLLSLSTQAINTSINLSTDTSDTYKSVVSTARTNINTSLSSVNSQIQSLSSQKFVVKRVENELALKKAGTSQEELAAQEAVVKQARAKSQAIRAQIEKLVLRAPFAGTITLLEAKIGEIVSPNITIVSLISENQMEIEANVPEVDIGAVTIGSPVIITLDAYPGEILNGKVVSIDPAETIIDGVTNFKIKVAFDAQTKKELLRSGLTANLGIITQEKNDVIVVPQYALFEKEGKMFANRFNSSTETYEEVVVTTGLRGEDGLVEITEGLEVGQEVANVGIKIN